MTVALEPCEFQGFRPLPALSMRGKSGVSRLCRLAAPGMMIAIRSIFSACNALCQGGLLTLHDVPPSICYPSGRRWQRRGPKPGEQRNLDLRIGCESASRHDDCQHQGGRGPAVRGKVNPGEVLIKVVTGNKPKMLSGLNQKGTWSGTGASSSPVADVAPPADKERAGNNFPEFSQSRLSCGKVS